MYNTYTYKHPYMKENTIHKSCREWDWEHKGACEMRTLLSIIFIIMCQFITCIFF